MQFVLGDWDGFCATIWLYILKNYVISRLRQFKIFRFLRVAPKCFQVWKMAQRSFEFDTTDIDSNQTKRKSCSKEVIGQNVIIMSLFPEPESILSDSATNSR